jgi:hypothetical protein
MLDVPERAERETASDAHFIRQQMAGLAGIIDRMRAERGLDPERLAALREIEESYELLEARLAGVVR